MKIIKVENSHRLKIEAEPMTEEQLQNEYDFHMAEMLNRMLYEEGKITEDELRKISALNRQKFSPKLSELMS